MTKGSCGHDDWLKVPNQEDVGYRRAIGGTRYATRYDWCQTCGVLRIRYDRGDRYRYEYRWPDEERP